MPFNVTCRDCVAVLVASLAVLATPPEALAGGGCPPSGTVGTWTWDGGGDATHWSDANNWSPNSVPPANADVIINDAVGPVVLKHPSAVVTVNTLICNGTLELEGVSSAGVILSLTECATIDTLVIDTTMDQVIVTGPSGSVLTVTDVLHFPGGSKPLFMSSGVRVHVPQGAVANLSGLISLNGAAVFENDGITTLDDAEIRMHDTALFHNANDVSSPCGSVADPPGRVYMKNWAGFVTYGGSPQVINDGCWETSGTGDAGVFNSRFVSNGTLTVSNGTRLQISDATCDGPIHVGDNAMLDLADVAGGSLPGFVSTPDSSINCAATGTIRCYSAGTSMNITINGAVDVQGTWQQSPPGVGIFGAGVTFTGAPKHFANYDYYGDGLGGNALFEISNHMEWVNDGVSVPISIPPGAELDIMPSNGGGGAKHLYSTVEIGGIARVHADAAVNFWCGGGPCTIGLLHILEGGQLELGDNCGFSGGVPTNVGSVLNEGTVTTAPGHKTSIFFLPFTNAGTLHVNSGTVKFARSFTQNAGGQTILEGGTLESVWYWFPSFVLNGGTLRGQGWIIGDVTNNTGTVACGNSPGTIVVTGNYHQGAGGTLAIELAGTTVGTGYDQLQVGGTASLNGSLTVALIDAFVPSVNDVFTVVDAGAVTGSFGQCCYVDPYFYVAYTPTTVVLQRVLPCLGDIMCGRSVDIDDLLAVINAWGPYQAPLTACSADIVPVGGDAAVNIDDLLAVINGWGPCP